ncbi:tetratricopeptide repeat protein [Lysinibacillus sp. Bpr_S20]|uniref:tetratricopeptide repeat protein n=1 Tax=Lysinibacillus sp. Bpr_S20 TaxID=2933964 RepID=UPI002010FE3A|nr:tetratricopeptide repeat protein [Lysinibacillus sp. Bpr_S20]MCL1699515.1 tetratricopeptide repeat protein [Lysinibacillus sp. Bpr_S20]
MENTIHSALHLRRQGKLQESKEMFLTLLSIDPLNPSLHYQCARSFDILAEETKAMPFYEQAIELGLTDCELEDAFIKLGSIYRTHERFLEAKKLYQEAMRKFPKKEQMKIFYAMALYNLGDHADAMGFLIGNLAFTTTNQDILKHYRTITYLGSRLDSSSDEIITIDKNQPLQPTTKSIVEKVTEGLKGFGIGGFYTSSGFEYDEYYRFFNDRDLETRRCALAAFTVMLGAWHALSGFTFIPQHDRKYLRGYNPNEPFHELNNYIEAIVTHHQQIKQDFPVMFEYIIDFLISIEVERKVPYEKWFPELDAQLVQRLRDEVLLPNKSLLDNPTEYKYFLREAGIPPFFEDDFFE